MYLKDRLNSCLVTSNSQEGQHSLLCGPHAIFKQLLYCFIQAITVGPVLIAEFNVCILYLSSKFAYLIIAFGANWGGLLNSVHGVWQHRELEKMASQVIMPRCGAA